MNAARGRTPKKPDRRAGGYAPKKTDRRAKARRRADKLAAKLKANDLDRLGALEDLGMGPLSFDCRMARQHGWTNAEIARYWDDVTAIYKRISRVMHKRYPERYDMRDPKLIVFIGSNEKL